MARRTIETTLADKVVDATLRSDFDPSRFGLIMTRCGWKIQLVLFKIVLSLIRHWTIDYEAGETRDCDSDDYLMMTMYARMLQDTIDTKKIR
jgi:hypothetical protein